LSNLDIVREAVDAFSRGDVSGWIESFHADVVWVPATDIPDIGPSHGKEELLELMQAWLEPWDRFEVETLALEEHGDKVLWTYVQRASQKGTGLTFDTELSAVCEFRDGLVSRMTYFWDRADARRAIGLTD
jgi:ketosteroid isomerase-like protein